MKEKFEKVKKWIWKHKIISLIIFITFVGVISGAGNEETTITNTQEKEEIEVVEEIELTDEEKAEKKYQEWVKSQFSVWNGSHKALVNLVKNNLHDPKSFEHVETRYVDQKGKLIIHMRYRANNAFGGKVLESVVAESDYETNRITIIN